MTLICKKFKRNVKRINTFRTRRVLWSRQFLSQSYEALQPEWNYNKMFPCNFCYLYSNTYDRSCWYFFFEVTKNRGNFHKGLLELLRWKIIYLTYERMLNETKHYKMSWIYSNNYFIRYIFLRKNICCFEDAVMLLTLKLNQLCM